MIPLYPLIAVLGETIAKTIDKLNFNKNKITVEHLIFLIFITMFVSLVALILFSQEAFPVLDGNLVLLVILMIIFSFSQNLFDFRGLSTKNLSLREPINNFEPILTSFLAFMLFPSEREMKYIIAIIFGSAVLYWGNSNKKLKLNIDQGIIYLFLGVICSSILSNIYKYGLEEMSAPYLFLFRVVGILVLLALFFKINLKGISSNQVSYGVAAGFLYFVGFLFRLFSIEFLGLNLTIMVLLLGPAIIYFLSAFVLKEELKKKQVLSSALIALIILITLFV